MTEIYRAMNIATHGIRAQGGRMRVIAENIANVHSTPVTAGGDPYRRHIPIITSKFNHQLQANIVSSGKYRLDNSEFPIKLDPSHPGADDTGYVKMPNVNELIEMVDMREAQRAYEANLNVIVSAKSMLTKTINILVN